MIFELRFILRDGKKILQYRERDHYHIVCDSDKTEGETPIDSMWRFDWCDVPLVEFEDED